MGLIEEKLALLPDKPGSYQMRDKNGDIIYVGKAKNLKNRVRSYFHGKHNMKTNMLVSEIADFKYVITSTEQEAFVLEINLVLLVSKILKASTNSSWLSLLFNFFIISINVV